MSRPSRPSPPSGPTQPGGHTGRRLAQLYAGLLLFGGSIGLMVESGLGLPPWDVLHQGLARHTTLSIGTVSVVAGAVVLLLWVPMRQRPGLGTVSNVVLVGVAMDATILLTPAPDALALRIFAVAAGVVLNGVATGLYISARFGPGPRDGLMTGLHRVTGRSVRLVRTGIEATVLVSGLLLGGTAGAGTVVYALAIGPLSQLFLRVFAVPAAPAGPSDGAPLIFPGSSHVVARGTGRRNEDETVGRRRAWWRGGAILRR
ncbi:YitT family protein [Streptomyces sp. WMMB 322]|uniref:membrane protein YczE n=1 Tax=Streptomyces sp. WMMB 322 TaxID=1286821 RepID=UPI000823A2F9|nr:hypothetical protein [Streptomyces sp. WMMB 322]SCK56927.1 Uncharacterized membrane protein YczE [Streptomyces sp. WMMB 322]